MGGGQSKSRSETMIETSVVNDTAFNVLNKSENAVAASVFGVQDMTVRGITAYCNLDVNQKINGNIKVLQTFKEQDSQKLVNDIMADLEKKAENKAKQETGFANPFGGNNAEQVNKTKTSITNKLTKNITNETINTLQAKVVLNQKLVTENLIIDPCGIGVYEKLKVPPPVELVKACVMAKPCKLGQDMVIKFVAEQIGEKISEIINEDKNAQKLRDDLSSQTEQKTEGAGEAVADAAKGIGEGVGTAAEGVGAGVGNALGAGSGASIASAVASCVMVIAAGAFAMSPAGQNMTKSAGKGR